MNEEIMNNDVIEETSIEEIEITPVYEEESKSSGSMIRKIVTGAAVIGAIVGIGALLNKKAKPAIEKWKINSLRKKGYRVCEPDAMDDSDDYEAVDNFDEDAE